MAICKQPAPGVAATSSLTVAIGGDALLLNRANLGPPAKVKENGGFRLTHQRGPLAKETASTDSDQIERFASGCPNVAVG
jgi:hypothetical protein